MQKIIVVEDDDSVREMVMYALRTAGFEVAAVADGEAVFPELADAVPSLVLLDIMLPGMDGLSVLQRMRQTERYRRVPVIMLTAKGDELDRIKGLDLGADDYIAKPFSVLEVISRVRAVLRRSDLDVDYIDELAIGPITLSQEKRTVTVDGAEVALTFKEFGLLQFLMLNKDIVFGRGKLLEQVWGFEYYGESRTVDMHIKTLRQKLGTAGEAIKTVRNVGYKIG